MPSAFDDPERDLTAAEVAKIMAAGDLQLVDVREPYEREAGYIAGSVHIELEHLASRAPTLNSDLPIVFYCRLGARSAMATQAFRAAGFDARNMAGGIAAWAASGLPVAPDGGTVANH
ncbi:MAG: rhodanese-like domain-containing protein [Solirubrobacterales bacterium]|nr:rhodanese-like domain-containing protein [Solirubrobacterales bacterium]